MKTRGSGLAIIHLIGGNVLNSLDPHAKTSRIFRLKPSRISTGNNVFPRALKLRSKAESRRLKAQSPRLKAES